MHALIQQHTTESEGSMKTILLQNGICNRVQLAYFLCKRIGSPTVRIKIPANAKRKFMITSIKSYNNISPDN